MERSFILKNILERLTGNNIPETHGIEVLKGKRGKIRVKKLAHQFSILLSSVLLTAEAKADENCRYIPYPPYQTPACYKNNSNSHALPPPFLAPHQTYPSFSQSYPTYNSFPYYSNNQPLPHQEDDDDDEATLFANISFVFHLPGQEEQSYGVGGHLGWAFFRPGNSIFHLELLLDTHLTWSNLKLNPPPGINLGLESITRTEFSMAPLVMTAVDIGKYVEIAAGGGIGAGGFYNEAYDFGIRSDHRHYGINGGWVWSPVGILHAEFNFKIASWVAISAELGYERMFDALPEEIVFKGKPPLEVHGGFTGAIGVSFPLIK